MLSVTYKPLMLFRYAECLYAECLYAKGHCHFTECHLAEGRGADNPVDNPPSIFINFKL
jgi:hypothetical protein